MEALPPPSKRGVKRAREESDDGTRVISPHALLISSQFADEHPLIYEAERYHEETLFDNPDAPWFIEWLDHGAVDYQDASTKTPDYKTEITRPALWNTPGMRHLIRSLLSRGLQHVRRQQFVGYWYLRGSAMIQWWLAFLSAPPHEQADLGLPCGILEPTDAIFAATPRAIGGPLARSITVLEVPMAADRPQRYDYAVFEQGATLIPMSPTELTAMRKQAKQRLRVSAMTVENDMASDAARVVRPRTWLYDVMMRDDMAQESAIYHMDAECSQSQPRVLLRKLPLDTTGTTPETLTTDQFYEHNTLMDALLNQAAQSQQYAAEAVQTIVAQEAAANSALLTAAQEARGETLTEGRHRYFQRPSFRDRPWEISRFEELAHFHEPKVVNDLTMLEDRVAMRIAAAMRVPLDVLLRGRATADAAAAGSVRQERTLMGGARAIETHADRRQQDVLAREQTMASALWTHIYQHVFAPLNLLALDNMMSDIYAMQLDLPLGSEGEALVAVAGGKLVADVRALLLELQEVREARLGAARLSFETVQTVQNAVKLRGLLEIYDRGLLDPKHLSVAVRDVYGEGFPLREPPMPPAPSGPAPKPKPKPTS